jgi:hypothetical protein
MLNRGRNFVTLFATAAVFLLSCTAGLQGVEAASTGCPAIIAKLNITSQGFPYVVQSPSYEFVLAPGSNGTIVLNYTGLDDNNMKSFLESPPGNMFAYPYLDRAGSDGYGYSGGQVLTNETGILIAEENISYQGAHTQAVVTLDISASSSAQQGAYMLTFPSSCNRYYLVVGQAPVTFITSPSTDTTQTASAQPESWISADLPYLLAGVIAVIALLGGLWYVAMRRPRKPSANGELPLL